MKKLGIFVFLSVGIAFGESFPDLRPVLKDVEWEKLREQVHAGIGLSKKEIDLTVPEKPRFGYFMRGIFTEFLPPQPTVHIRHENGRMFVSETYRFSADAAHRRGLNVVFIFGFVTSDTSPEFFENTIETNLTFPFIQKEKKGDLLRPVEWSGSDTIPQNFKVRYFEVRIPWEVTLIENPIRFRYSIPRQGKLYHYIMPSCLNRRVSYRRGEIVDLTIEQPEYVPQTVLIGFPPRRSVVYRSRPASLE